MRIAIFGSWRSSQGTWASRGLDKAFREAAFDLGRQLAHAGQTVIVGGTSPRTADVHVVRGYLAVSASDKSASCRIQVIRPIYSILRPFGADCRSEGWPLDFELWALARAWSPEPTGYSARFPVHVPLPMPPRSTVPFIVVADASVPV